MGFWVDAVAWGECGVWSCMVGLRDTLIGFILELAEDEMGTESCGVELVFGLKKTVFRPEIELTA